MRFILTSLLFIPYLISLSLNPELNQASSSIMLSNLDVTQEDTLVQMERTVCFGTCPSYTLSILENGKITFNGRDYVAHEGEATKMMSQDNLDQLKREIRESHFMEIPANPECDSRFTDHSSVYVTIRFDDREHSVNHYQGCKGFPFEEELYKLEEAIDSLSGTDRWIEGVEK